MTKSASEKPSTTPAPAWHASFLKMLPIIRTCARIAFRHLQPEARDEAIQEVIANAMSAYVRLVELGKTAVAYPTVLARFAIAQFRDGRRVGASLNIREVLSKYAQRMKRLIVERLDHFDIEENEWKQAVVEDNQTPVPDQVAFRIDFPAWLASLSGRDRRIAQALALGHSTGRVARRFSLSSGRISQKRREFFDSWKAFHGEGPMGNNAA
jgi:hypothetical protein